MPLVQIWSAWLYIPPEYLVVVENVRPRQDAATTGSLSLLLGNGVRLVGRLRGVAVATSIAWPHRLTPTARRVSSLVLYVLWTILLILSLSRRRRMPCPASTWRARSRNLSEELCWDFCAYTLAARNTRSARRHVLQALGRVDVAGRAGCG